VNDCDLAAAARGERRLDDALGAVAGDLGTATATSGVGMVAEPLMHGAVRIKPSVFSRTITKSMSPASRRQSGPQRRPDIGEQVEPLAQLAGQVEPAWATSGYSLCDTGPDDSVRLRCLRDHFILDGGAGGLERIESDRGRLKGQVEPEYTIGFTQHIDGGAHDFRPDAVARQDKEVGRSSVKLGVACFGLVFQRHLLLRRN
jgi:hypothetical protein